MRYLASLLLLALVASVPAAQPPAHAAPLVEMSSLGRVVWEGTSEVAPVPMSLTASDGTGLKMSDLKVRSVVQDPLAFTELTMTFENPEDRTIEGRFEITLPDGAAISRFAMKIDGRWQEGEVVEKQRARQVYEDFLHRGQDPALLEKDAGNSFRARVFPIPAKGRKELVISWSHALESSSEPYRVVLDGLPELDELDVHVASDAWYADTPHDVYSLVEQGVSPQGTLAVDLGASRPLAGLRSGDLGLARVRPVLSTPRQPVTSLSVLFDTSASRALGFEAQIQRLEDLARALDPFTPLTVVAFDQDAREVYSGLAGDFSTSTTAALRDRGALGASNLERALTYLADSPTGHERVLLMTDGVPTAGARDLGGLQERVDALAGVGVVRVDALAAAGLRDEHLLTGLTRAGLPSHGVVLEAEAGVQSARERLDQATVSDIAVSVPGAEWVWPETLDGLQAGDEVLVYAVLPEAQPMTVQLAGMAVETPSRFETVDRPLLERAVVGANIARLTAAAESAEGDARQKRIADIVELSTSFRVLSDYTSLLVLETQEDYERYAIARDALADVLVAGETGIELQQRTELIVAEPVRPDPKPTKSKRRFRLGFSMAKDMAEAPAEPAMDVSDAPPTSMVQEREAAEEAQVLMAVAPAAGESSRMMAREEGRQARRSHEEVDADVEEEEPAPLIAPWEGRYAEVRTLLAGGRVAEALAQARAWRAEQPGDVLALVALGEALEALGDRDAAARAYGSIIDLFPSRADLRRMAAERLERLAAGRTLALDSYAVAIEQRPDHPSGHRLYAWALAKDGQLEAAFDTMEAAVKRSYPRGRVGVAQIMLEDLGILGAALGRAEPTRRQDIAERVKAAGGTEPAGASVRFVLTWETDANDVDLHIRDARGGHAYYSNKTLPSGGELIADVTNGYGPEAFVLPEGADAYPYTIQAHYYSRGPLGYGMGTLQVVQWDPALGLAFDDRPFVIQADGATVELGALTGRL